MSEQPLDVTAITVAIARLELKPTDVLVVTAPAGETSETYERIKRVFQEIVPCPVMVMDGNISLAVISEGDAVGFLA